LDEPTGLLVSSKTLNKGGHCPSTYRSVGLDNNIGGRVVGPQVPGLEVCSNLIGIFIAKKSV